MLIHVLNENGETDMARKTSYRVQQWGVALMQVTQANPHPAHAYIKLFVTCKIQPKTVEKPVGLTHTVCGHIHGRP